jgi:BA14K-like protein
MTKFNILGTAAVLSLMFATPVFAQAAIQEPGAFAFAYPNNDVLNGGRPTPAATREGGPYASIDPQAARMDANSSNMPVVFGSNPYAANSSVAMNDEAGGAACAQRYRSYDPASGTFLGRDGRRHDCR